MTQWSQTQLDNAKTIVRVGQDMKMSDYDIQVALMTALTESGLQNYANSSVPESLQITHDAVGNDNDSVGLFQQRPSQGWGSTQELMDPATSARKFYEAIQRGISVHAKTIMTPWQVAQTIQRSGTPDGSNYQKHYADAQEIFKTLGFTPNGTVGGIKTGAGSWFESLQNIGDFLGNGKNWQRIGLGVLGAILILAALWNILNQSSTFRAGVNTAKKAVEVAAVA